MFRRILIAAAVLVVLSLVTAAALAYLYNEMLQPVDPDAGESFQIIEIPPGANSEIIADTLYHEGLIRNQLVFRIYVHRHNLGQGFMAGRYNLSPSMSLDQIISKIQAGDVYTETVWFTIPEGYTVEQMASRLEEDGLVDGEQFLLLARQPPDALIADFPFLAEADAAGVDYVLEGYLFPDTYEIFIDAGEVEIIRIMLNRLDQVINEEKRNRIDELGSSLHEILAIAALVEREAAVDHERSRIAGVIYNRLAIGQYLQIDATIQYILGETKEFLTFADLEIPSPYNTYQNPGLPPGPIAAPGEASIIAALYPEDTDYYYYNYKYDGTGEHFFSHTFSEHLENVRRAESNLP
jgi:UPF0755 protein